MAQRNFSKTFLITGLVAGFLDGAAATIHTLIASGKNPKGIALFIASGIFGKEAWNGGGLMIFYGIVIHFFIAMAWTFLFFKVYQKLTQIPRSWIMTGILYGIIVWMCMNLIVVPLSNTQKFPFSFTRVLIGTVTLIICIGLPIAFSATQFFSAKKKA